MELQFRVNLFAPLLLAQTVAQHMRGRGAGSIVNISSTLSKQTIPNAAVYSATKSALDSITRSMALELGSEGVRVNSVLPGVVDTDMVRGRVAELAAQHVLGRVGRPEEVAQVIVETLDHEWQTGSLVVIDGGISLKG